MNTTQTERGFRFGKGACPSLCVSVCCAVFSAAVVPLASCVCLSGCFSGQRVLNRLLSEELPDRLPRPTDAAAENVSSAVSLGTACVDSELVGQVLSPHPSQKLLLLTSTVMLQNCSGLPLEVCFLDANMSPLLLPAAAAATTPLSVLSDRQGSQVGGGRAAETFREVVSLDPQLGRAPQWMLERQELWRQQELRELQQQQELLRQLEIDSSSSGSSGSIGFRLPSSRRNSPPPRQSLQHQCCSREAYTFLLPNAHFMSVPRLAIFGPGWVNVSFRPAAFAAKPADIISGGQVLGAAAAVAAAGVAAAARLPGVWAAVRVEFA